MILTLLGPYMWQGAISLRVVCALNKVPVGLCPRPERDTVLAPSPSNERGAKARAQVQENPIAQWWLEVHARAIQPRQGMSM